MEYIDFEYYIYKIKNRSTQQPVSHDLEKQLNAAIDEVYVYEDSNEERELLTLLRSLKELCWAHDAIANKDYEPKLCAVPFEVDEDEEVYRKLCTIYKSIKEPLGATIKTENIMNESQVLIARIMNAGFVDRSKLLKSGDRILEVNGVNTKSFKAEQVLPLLSPSNGVLKMTIEEEPSFSLLNYQDITNDDVFYARVLFNYKPMHDFMHPCKEASVELRAGDILEICDWSPDEYWWQGRLLSSFQHSNSPSLNAIHNVLSSLDHQRASAKQVASLIPSKKTQENAIMKSFSEKMITLDFNTVADNLAFKVELDGDDTERLIFRPNTYEELCIFDPIIQSPHKRPIAFYFAFDNKIVTSFKCNSSNSEVFNSGIFEHLSQVTKSLSSIFDDKFDFAKLYSPKSSTLGTPLLGRKNSLQTSATTQKSPFYRLIEKSCQISISKNNWDHEKQASGLVLSLFDELLGYKMSELWKDFLEKNEQIVIFPSFENFNHLRNTTPFGKMCFHIIINLKLSNMFDSLNMSTSAQKSPFKYQGSLNRKNKKISTSKNTVDEVKHLFDAYVDKVSQPPGEFINTIKSYIDNLNQMPSYVIK